MRIIVDLTKKQIDSVQALAQSRGCSPEEIIRQAIDGYILEEVFASLDAAKIPHDFLVDREKAPPQEREDPQHP